MKNLPTVKKIVNTPSILGEYTFEDLVTLGRVNAKDATETCISNAQKEYLAMYGMPKSLEEALKMVKLWETLEKHVLRKFKEAQEISEIL